MQLVQEGHGGSAWIFTLCIAAAPRRLTSRFPNFLLSPADCRKEPQPAISPRNFKHEPFPFHPRITFLWHSLLPHPSQNIRCSTGLYSIFPKPSTRLSLRRHSVSGPLWFPFWAKVPFQTMPCRLLFVALPRLPSTCVRHGECTIRPTVHQFVGRRLYSPARSRRPSLSWAGRSAFLDGLESEGILRNLRQPTAVHQSRSDVDQSWTDLDTTVIHRASSPPVPF